MSNQSRIHIGSVIRNGVAFQFKNGRGGAANTDSLLLTVDRLLTLLHERRIEYVLVGGVAMLQYVEGRNTLDLDLIMALASLRKLPELHITHQEPDFARATFDGLQIDLLLTRNPLFDKVRREYATLQRFKEADITCATVEGLLLLKLYALPALYRQGNFPRVNLYESDISRLLYQYRTPLEPLFAELALHLSQTDLAAVREIAAEIEQRGARFRRGLDDAGPHPV